MNYIFLPRWSLWKQDFNLKKIALFFFLTKKNTFLQIKGSGSYLVRLCFLNMRLAFLGMNNPLMVVFCLQFENVINISTNLTLFSWKLHVAC